MHTVIIYGAGCAKCAQVEALVRQVVLEAHLAVAVHKVGDISEIVAAGVISTPTVAVDDVIKSSGRVPTTVEIHQWLMG